MRSTTLRSVAFSARLLLASVALACAWPAVATGAEPFQTGDAPAAAIRKIEVTVERKRGDRVESVEPNHVFERGEMVRFRFNATFQGYLYVLNHSTSGKYSVLFPNPDTGLENHIERGHSYVLPMTGGGWFRLEAPAGYEVIYWVVSPVRLGESDTGAFRMPDAPVETKPLDAAITPRCDDSIFHARGECIDTQAGAKPVEKQADVPDVLSSWANDRSRELTFSKSGKKTSVVLPSGEDTPFIYVFRLAHK